MSMSCYLATNIVPFGLLQSPFAHIMNACRSFSTALVAYNLQHCSSTSLPEPQALHLAIVSLFPATGFTDPCWSSYTWIARKVVARSGRAPPGSWGEHTTRGWLPNPDGTIGELGPTLPSSIQSEDSITEAVGVAVLAPSVHLYTDCFCWSSPFQASVFKSQ